MRPWLLNTKKDMTTPSRLPCRPDYPLCRKTWGFCCRRAFASPHAVAQGRCGGTGAGLHPLVDDKDAPRIARLFGNLYAKLGEVYELKRETYKEWSDRTGRKP